MRVQRVAYRSINRALSAFHLQIVPINLDFEEFPSNETIRIALFQEMAACAEEWLGKQDCFQAVGFDIQVMVKEFLSFYLKSPFRKPDGGSRFNNLLWLAIIARAYNPAIIVDSGTFMGASAAALKFGAPHAEVWSFDIDLSRIGLRIPGVEYREHDWTGHDFGARAGQRTLVYFDDHLDQARRLLEAQERNFDLAIFDDDFPVVPALAMAHGGMALPKIEFVLNDQLRGEKEIVWKSKGRTFRWPVDAAYLDRARAAIVSTCRFPNTSLLTGLHQTPYRIVKMQPNS